MFVLPLLSIAVEASTSNVSLDVSLAAKWFVFWAVGWRLFLAGLRQVLQPGYTAREIFGLNSSESNVLVRELGFGNLSLGLIAILSFWLPSWRLAGALAGGLFYGMAGITHTLQQHRNRLENVAMSSDLFAAMVLLGICVMTFVHG
jgi:uncharacterized protein DUF6790